MTRSRILVATLTLASMLAMAIPALGAPQVAILEVKGMVCSA